MVTDVQDLFRAGFSLAKKDSQFNLIPVSVGYAMAPAKDGMIKSCGFVQFSSKAEPLFLHRVLNAKFSFDKSEGSLIYAVTAPFTEKWIDFVFHFSLNRSDSRMLMRKWIAEVPRSTDLPSMRAHCGTSNTAGFFCMAKFKQNWILEDEMLPIFFIKNTSLEEVYLAQMMGWKRVLHLKKLEPMLFENPFVAH